MVLQTGVFMKHFNSLLITVLSLLSSASFATVYYCSSDAEVFTAKVDFKDDGNVEVVTSETEKYSGKYNTLHTRVGESVTFRNLSTHSHDAKVMSGSINTSYDFGPAIGVFVITDAGKTQHYNLNCGDSSAEDSTIDLPKAGDPCLHKRICVDSLSAQ